jgi:hypothetical protein
VPTGALDAIGLQTRGVYGRFNKSEDCPSPKSACPPSVLLPALEKGARMPVTIGVDPHKASHTAAALDEHGRLLDRQRVPATVDGYQRLCQWGGPLAAALLGGGGRPRHRPGAGPAAGQRSGLNSHT